MVTAILKYDTSILEFIRKYMHSVFLDKAMPVITALGNGAVVWIGISLFLIINKKYRYVGFMVFVALALSSLLGDLILKNIIERARPCAGIPAAKMLIPKPLTYSFPSGHTASSFAAAGILAGEFKRYRFYIFSLASIIAFSRMYLYVHYPTDIIGGIIVGLFSAKVVLAVHKYKIGSESLQQ